VSAPSRPFSPGAALLLLLVYFAANAVVLLIGDSLSDGPVGSVFFAAAAVLAPLVAVYVGLVRHAPDEPTAAALVLKAPHGRAWVHIALAVVIGAALAPLAYELTARLIELLPAGDAPDEVMLEWLAAQRLPATQALVDVSALLLIPFTRETLFRGLMLPRLGAVLGTRRAVSLVVLLDLVTQPFPELPPHGLVAAVPLCMLAIAARSTWAPFAGHVALIAATYGVNLQFGDHSPTVLIVGGATLALAATALSWRLRIVAPSETA
jgi:membrane protease YdiL (CAAX protease family)